MTTELTNKQPAESGFFNAQSKRNRRIKWDF